MPRYPGILETDTLIQELASNCAMASIYHDNLELSWTHAISHKTYAQLADSGGDAEEENTDGANWTIISIRKHERWLIISKPLTVKLPEIYVENSGK